MSSKHKKKFSSQLRYVMLHHWVMKTEAWQSLDGNARAIYLEIARRYAGSNNGTITYSAREAASSLRIGKDTANRALKALQDRGFLVVMTKGAFHRKNRHATEWRLTEHPCDVTGELATKEFSMWSPDSQITCSVVTPLPAPALQEAA